MFAGFGQIQPGFRRASGPSPRGSTARLSLSPPGNVISAMPPAFKCGSSINPGWRLHRAQTVTCLFAHRFQASRLVF